MFMCIVFWSWFVLYSVCNIGKTCVIQLEVNTRNAHVCETIQP